MSGVAMIFREYWEQRKLIPKGVWLILIAYCLVALGSPMPPKITWLEIVMGCGLLMGGILLTGLVIRKVQQEKSAQWCFGLTALLFLIPLCIGLMRGNMLSDITRDIFPLTFLLIVPILLIYAASLTSRVVLSTLIATALAFVGICTAITFYSGAFEFAGSTDRMVTMVGGGFGQIASTQTTQTTQTTQAIQTTQMSEASKAADEELANKQRVIFLKLYDPAMLFSAILLSSWGVVLMVKSWRGWLPGIILAGAGALIAYGFMMLGLRAYTVLFALAVLTICLTKWRERGFYTRLLPIILVAGIVLWPKITAIVQLLWNKQQVVGLNGKAGEWWAVIHLVFSSPQTALFGIGWGGMVTNPIVDGATRFTHSALSFYLLKSGLLGLLALMSIIVILFFQGLRLGDKEGFTTSRLILLISCLPPLLIGLLLEPSYKMLSYGVILALFVLVFPSFGKRVE